MRVCEVPSFHLWVLVYFPNLRKPRNREEAFVPGVIQHFGNIRRLFRASRVLTNRVASLFSQTVPGRL